MRWPSTSSSSQVRRRGQARASDSWASSTVWSSLVTSRARDEQLDEPFVFRVGGDGAAGDAAAHRFAFRGGRHQAQEQVAQQWLLCGGHLVVDLLGRLGDRAADPARVLVAGDGERAALAPLPRLVQRVRQQRQRPGLALDLPHQQIDQTRLQQQADLAGGTLDRGPQVALAHRAQQMQPRLDEPGEPGWRGQLAKAIGAQRDDQRATFGVDGEARRRTPACGRVVAQGDRLLALVDDQDRHRTRRRQGDERVHRPRTRRDHDDMTAVAAERRQPRRLAPATTSRCPTVRPPSAPRPR